MCLRGEAVPKGGSGAPAAGGDIRKSLPALQGSEKQIKWAEEIRDGAIDSLERAVAYADAFAKGETLHEAQGGLLAIENLVGIQEQSVKMYDQNPDNTPKSIKIDIEDGTINLALTRQRIASYGMKRPEWKAIADSGRDPEKVKRDRQIAYHKAVISEARNIIKNTATNAGWWIWWSKH